MQTVKFTKHYDPWLKERDQSVWIAKIRDQNNSSDEFRIYQDEGHPETDDGQPTWMRLKRWLKENPHYQIVGLGAAFRDHEEWVEENAQCYYFSRGVMADMLGGTSNYYILGYYKYSVNPYNQLIKKWFRIPEIIEYDCSFDNLDFNDPKTIVNQYGWQRPQALWKPDEYEAYPIHYTNPFVSD